MDDLAIRARRIVALLGHEGDAAMEDICDLFSNVDATAGRIAVFPMDDEWVCCVTVLRGRFVGYGLDPDTCVIACRDAMLRGHVVA